MKRLLLAFFIAAVIALIACSLIDSSLFRAWWGPTPSTAPLSPLPAHFHDATCKLPSGENARYVVYTPPDYEPARPCPLIVFLHGLTKRGTDGRSHFADGVAPAIRSWPGWQEHGHFLVLFPQGRSGQWLLGSSDDELVMAELTDVQSHYSVDAARIYLTGISTGGTGTWDLAAGHPDVWAAIVPVCGMPKTENVVRIRHLPCWCFHGGADSVAPPEPAREMMRQLVAEGAKTRYTEYPGAGHSIWDQAYRSAELYEWLRRQKRD